MKRAIIAALALILLIGLQPQAARAQGSNNTNNNNFWTWLFGNQDPRLAGVGIGLGIGAGITSYFLTEKHGNPGVRSLTPLAAYGATAAGCVIVYPFLGTWALNRPLTPREMYVGSANCIVPIVGGWIVNAVLPHDAWTDGTPPKPVRHHHHKK